MPAGTVSEAGFLEAASEEEHVPAPSTYLSSKDYFKLKEKGRKAKRIEAWENLSEEAKQEHIKSRVQRQAESLRRLTEAVSSPHSLNIAIDLSFDEEEGKGWSSHTDAERKSMCYQIGLAYGLLKKVEKPAHLHLTGLDLAHPVSTEMLTKLGAFNWQFVSRHTRPAWEQFDRDRVVLLSPDADEALPDVLDTSLVYVIGGIVDKSVRKAITLQVANRQCLRAMRLPIQEHIERRQGHVLNIDTVAHILCDASISFDWKATLEKCMPQRRQIQGGKNARRKLRQGDQGEGEGQGDESGVDPTI